MNKGSLYGFTSGVLWAINSTLLSIVFIMVDFKQYVLFAPIIATFMNDLFSAITMWVKVLLIDKKPILAQKINKKDLSIVVFASLLGAPIGMGGYVLAIANLGASYTATFSTLYPVVGVIGAYIILKERLNKRGLLGIIISIIATMLLSYNNDNVSVNLFAGLLGILMCIVGWGLEGVVLSKAMNSLEEQVVLMIRQSISVISFLAIININFFNVDLINIIFNGQFIMLVIGSAIAGTLSYLAYYKAINLLGAAKAMGLNISYSAWTVIIGIIFLQQTFDLKLILCCIAIILGAVLTSDIGVKYESE